MPRVAYSIRSSAFASSTVCQDNSFVNLVEIHGVFEPRIIADPVRSALLRIDDIPLSIARDLLSVLIRELERVPLLRQNPVLGASLPIEPPVGPDARREIDGIDIDGSAIGALHDHVLRVDEF